jgi:hypothetical protein
MRDEYGFSLEELRSGVRGKYAERFERGMNHVAVVPDGTNVRPDAEAVNQARRPCAHPRTM